MLKIFALLVAVASAQTGINQCPGDLSTKGWCDCAGAASDIVVTDFTLSPNPPQKGANLTVSITALDSKTQPITGGNIHVDVKFLGVSLLKQDFDLCQALEQAAKFDPSISPCPVQPFTAKTLGFTHEIPDVFPSGTYSGLANITDSNGGMVQCVQFKWKIDTA